MRQKWDSEDLERKKTLKQEEEIVEKLRQQRIVEEKEFFEVQERIKKELDNLNSLKIKSPNDHSSHEESKKNSGQKLIKGYSQEQNNTKERLDDSPALFPLPNKINS